MSPLIYEAARRYLLTPGPRRPHALDAAREYLCDIHGRLRP